MHSLVSIERRDRLARTLRALNMVFRVVVPSTRGALSARQMRRRRSEQKLQYAFAALPESCGALF